MTYKVLTGWVLGTGPCGPNCTMTSVGQVSSRTQMLQNTKEDFYGRWYSEVQTNGNVHGNSQAAAGTKNVTVQINRDLHEQVLSMNTKSQWELDMLDVTMIVPNDLNYADFM